MPLETASLYLSMPKPLPTLSKAHARHSVLFPFRSKQPLLFRNIPLLHQQCCTAQGTKVLLGRTPAAEGRREPGCNGGATRGRVVAFKCETDR